MFNSYGQMQVGLRNWNLTTTA